MRTIALLLTSSLLLSCATQPTTPQSTTLAATLETGGVQPSSQHGLNLLTADIGLNISPQHRWVDGQVVLALSTEQVRDSFMLNFDNNYQLERLEMANGRKFTYRHEQGELLIELADAWQIDETIELTISYHGHPHTAIRPPWEGGYVWDETADGKPWVSTAVQGEGCDLIWPCIDHPLAEPEQTDIRITVPKGLVAASNGVLIDSSESDNQITWHWRSKMPQNNYGIAINIGPYEVLKDTYKSSYGHEYPIVFYYLEGHKDEAKRLFKEFPKQLTFFEKVIGPYPFYQEKMGVVETSHLGMEHQTINAYGRDYEPGHYGFDSLLQHELAHEWFGNQITNTDWDHMWLHEGFGTYMQPLYAEYLHGDYAYQAMMLEMRRGLQNKFPIVSNKPMAEDDVYKEDVGPGGDIYAKGAWILHTLRQLIGDEAFFAATRKLVYRTEDPKPGNFKPHFSDTQYFIDAVNAATEKDYTWFFEHYLYQSKLPKLIERRTDNALILSWETQAVSNFKMPLDVLVNGEVRLVFVGNHDETVLSDIQPNDHIVVDPEHKVLREINYIAKRAEFDRSRYEEQIKAEAGEK